MTTRKRILIFALLLVLSCTIIFAQGKQREVKTISQKELRAQLHPPSPLKHVPKNTPSSYKSPEKITPMRQPSVQDSFSTGDRVAVQKNTDRQPLPLSLNKKRILQRQDSLRNAHESGTSSLSLRPLSSRSSGSLDQGNDACPPTIIYHVPYVDSGSTVGLANDFRPTCSPFTNTGPDVIYYYFPTQSGNYSITLVRSFPNHVISVRSGTQCPGNTELACGQNTLLVYLNAGTSYYILIDGYSFSDAGEYKMMFYYADCQYDKELEAPGEVSGMTCYAHNNCEIEPGEDQIVKVTIPHDGYWTFSLCDGQPWSARMYLMRGCCYDPFDLYSWYCYDDEHNERPSLYNVSLTAGTYYVDIESMHDRCGAWTLTVSEWICETHPVNDNCESVTPVRLPATFTGNNTCATPDCEFMSYSNTVWHAFTIDTLSDIFLDFCGTSDEIMTGRDYLIQGCPCNDYLWSDYYDYIPCGNDYVLRVFFSSLPAGTWYIPVLSGDWYDQGDYTINVQSVPYCTLSGQAGDIIECPETPGAAHDTLDCNGGCNTPNENYQTIESGTTIFGRTFFYTNPAGEGYRDTDWYHFTLTDTAYVHLSFEAEFPAGVGIFSINGCENQYVFEYAELIRRCAHYVLVSGCMYPGDYVLFVSIIGYDNSTNLKNYRMSFNALECTRCDLSPQPGDIDEGEGTCYDGYYDNFNVGCNGNDSYSSIECGQTVSGSSGVYWNVWGIDTVLFRDTDWYEFTIAEPKTLTWTVEADFYALIAICGGCDDEFDMAIVLADIYPCQQVTLNSGCVPAGTYYLYVSTSNWGPFPCGSKYRATLNCLDCTTCDSLAHPEDLVEGEPVCNDDYVDHYNGGCDSDPPVYGQQLALDQVVRGTSGKWYLRPLWTETWDSDWYRFTATQRIKVKWCAIGQFPIETMILGPSVTNSCDSVQVYSDFAFAASCDSACATAILTPGDYFLYVSNWGYYGAFCGQDYRAWITRAPCTPDSVADVSIRRINNNIVLRWTADSSYAGTYSIYHSSFDVPFPDSSWTVLASDIPPILGPDRTVYTINNAIAQHESQYYFIVGVCP